MHKKILLLIGLFASVSLAIIGLSFYTNNTCSQEEKELAAEYAIWGYTCSSDQRDLLQKRIDEAQDPETLGYSVVSRYKTTLASSMTSNQTTVPVSSITTFDGHTLTMNDLGNVVYLTLEPGSNREEIVKCTSISSSQWATCTRGLAFYGTSETSVAANRKAHNAGSVVIMSNVHYVYEQLLDKDTTQSISGDIAFTGTVSSTNNVFSYGSSVAACSANDELCDKEYIDGIASAGASDANITTKGLLELGYDDQVSVGGQTTSTLLTHFKLNENDSDSDFRDFASSTNLGWVGSISTSTSDLATTGKISGAFDFNGTSEYATTTEPGLDLTFLESSMSFWVNFDSFPSVAYLFDGVMGNSLSNFFYAGGLTNRLFFTYSSSLATETLEATNFSTNYSTDTWLHIVVVLDNSSDTAKLYINNTLIDTNTGVGTNFISGTSDLHIASESDTTDFFNGQIDDVRIYSTALTADEISYLYNNGEGTESPLNGDTSAYMCVEIGNYDVYSGAGKIPVANSTGYLEQEWFNFSSTWPFATNTLQYGAGAVTSSPGAYDVPQAGSTGVLEDGWLGGTTAGDLFYSNGTISTRLGIGTAGQVLQTNSGATAPEWSDLSLLTATSTTDNDDIGDQSTSEVTVYSTTIPGGTLGTGNVLKARIYTDNFQLDASQTVTFRMKYGGTTMVSSALTETGGSDVVTAKGYIDVLIFANGTTNSQEGNMDISFSEDLADGGTGDIDGIRGGGTGTAAVDSTANQTFAVTVQYGNNNAANGIDFKNAIVEVSKNTL